MFINIKKKITNICIIIILIELNADTIEYKIGKK